MTDAPASALVAEHPSSVTLAGLTDLVGIVVEQVDDCADDGDVDSEDERTGLGQIGRPTALSRCVRDTVSSLRGSLRRGSQGYPSDTGH